MTIRHKCFVSRVVVITLLLAAVLATAGTGQHFDLASELVRAAPAAERPPAKSTAEFIALSYHDIRAELPPNGDPRDPYALSLDTLVSHFAWLREHGYTPIRMDDLLAAQDGLRSLPKQPILLTFDDGLTSVYRYVFPLLRLFDFPAVVSVTGAWLDAPAGTSIDYNGIPLTREAFVSWSQLREMVDSGLVEVALHSYDLHRGVLGNRAGNLQPAAATRIFDPTTGSYEKDVAFRQRLADDLERGRELLRHHLGTAPRGLAWPFGASGGIAEEVAAELGFRVTLALHSGFQPVNDLRSVRRFSSEGGLPLQNLVWRLRHLRESAPERFITFDLDALDAATLQQRETKLDALLDFVERLDLSRVHLRVADPRIDDPRRDLLNRTVWQLQKRLGVTTALSLYVDVNTNYTHLYQAVEHYAAAAALRGLVLDAATTPGPDVEVIATDLRRRLRRHRPRAEIACRVDLRSTISSQHDLDPHETFAGDLYRQLQAQPAACDQLLVRLDSDQLQERDLDRLAQVLHAALPAPHIEDLRRLPWVELPSPAPATQHNATAEGRRSGSSARAQQLFDALRYLQRRRVLNLGLGTTAYPDGDAALLELRPAWSLDSFPYP